MKVTTIPIAFLVAFGLNVAAAPPVAQKATQLDAKPLVAEKLKTNGRFQIHQSGQYSVFADVNNAKIRAVKVSHPGFGGVPVKKYKSAGRVGYAYVDEKGAQVVYWFPRDMVEDPDKGAAEFKAP
jgi:hypothetical protein